MSEEKIGCAKILKIYRDSFSKSALGKKDLGVFGLDDLAEGKARVSFYLNPPSYIPFKTICIKSF